MHCANCGSTETVVTREEHDAVQKVECRHYLGGRWKPGCGVTDTKTVREPSDDELRRWALWMRGHG